MVKSVSMGDMLSLCELMVMKTYKKGSEIHGRFDESNRIYFLTMGHVKIGNWRDDRFLLKYTLGKGNIFGESKIVSGENPLPYSAIAMTDCLVCFIEVNKMEKLIEQFPKLHNFILKIAGLKLRKIETRLEDILYKDAPSRIHDFLFDYVKENAEEEDSRTFARNIFSHNEIAKLTLTSRQTVNNVISQLRESGDLVYSTKEIEMSPQDLSFKK